MPRCPAHSTSQTQPKPDEDSELAAIADRVAASLVQRATRPDQDLAARVAILEVDNQRLWAEVRRLRATLTEAATCLLTFSDRPSSPMPSKPSSAMPSK